MADSHHFLHRYGSIYAFREDVYNLSLTFLVFAGQGGGQGHDTPWIHSLVIKNNPNTPTLNEHRADSCQKFCVV